MIKIDRNAHGWYASTIFNYGVAGPEYHYLHHDGEWRSSTEFKYKLTGYFGTKEAVEKCLGNYPPPYMPEINKRFGLWLVSAEKLVPECIGGKNYFRSFLNADGTWKEKVGGFKSYVEAAECLRRNPLPNII